MADATAIVVGAGGGIGGALADELRAAGDYQVVALRRPEPDLCDESAIARAAERLRHGGEIRLIINAVGFLHGDGLGPEKSLREIAPDALARSFAVNAIGPALLMKHFLPLMPRRGRSVFASLSARVGSIGDNHLGGWYGYRASKAALNQLIRTAAIEFRRTHPDAICVALHPGTVATRLSAPFAARRQSILGPAEAARHLLGVIAKLGADASGGFFDWRGAPVPW